MTITNDAEYHMAVTLHQKLIDREASILDQRERKALGVRIVALGYAIQRYEIKADRTEAAMQEEAEEARQILRACNEGIAALTHLYRSKVCFYEMGDSDPNCISCLAARLVREMEDLREATIKSLPPDDDDISF